MERKGTDDWLRQVAEEEGDAEYLASLAVQPDDAEIPAWAATYWRAWHALKFDRQYGAFGGETPISFVAIDAYARRYGIRDVEFETFLAYLGALDTEYLQHVARREAEAKQAEDRQKERAAP